MTSQLCVPVGTMQGLALELQANHNAVTEDHWGLQQDLHPMDWGAGCKLINISSAFCTRVSGCTAASSPLLHGKL